MKRFAFPLLAGIVATGCGGAGNSTNNTPLGLNRTASPEAVRNATNELKGKKPAMVTVGMNNMGFRLLGELTKSKPGENVFISPASISTALAMAYSGAAGETKAAMERTLGIIGIESSDVNATYRNLMTVLTSPDPKTTLNVSNSAWAKKGFEFKKEYLAKVENTFQAKISELDFSAATAPDTINDWVKDSTNGKIPKLIEKIPSTAVLYLVNAVYFKGMWTEPFDKANTQAAPFTNFAGKKSDAQMMKRKDSFPYLDAAKFQAVRLPYGSGRLGAYVFVPKPNVKVNDLVKDFNGKNWDAWIKSMKPMDGTVQIPRFKSELSLNLNDSLKSLGMGIAFDDGKADFTGMRTERDLFISNVLHKTYVEVNEEGTEAAAATGVEIGVTSAPMPTKEFQLIADRPFIFSIVDSETNSILFIGIIGSV